MTDLTAAQEARIDRLVQRALATDAAYRYAPDAETQAERERELTAQAVSRVTRRTNESE